MSGFKSVFAERLSSYVALRRKLGLRFESQEDMLRAFDRFAHEHDHQGPLLEQLARSFAMAVPDVTTTIPSRRYLVVRHFAEYLATFDPSTPKLDPKAIFRTRTQPPPYIFTDEDLARLLARVAEFRQRHPVSNQAFHAMLGLAASSGLRLREVLGLDLSDVDLETGILVVRRTKFDKDRLVPVHATTLDVLRAYAAMRDQISGGDRRDGVLPQFSRTALSGVYGRVPLSTVGAEARSATCARQAAHLLLASPHICRG